MGVEGCRGTATEKYLIMVDCARAHTHTGLCRQFVTLVSLDWIHSKHIVRE